MLADYCITFLSTNEVNSMPKLFSLFSQYILVINSGFILYLDNLVSSFLPGLKTLDK